MQPSNRWCPHATVATVVVDQDRYLMVQEIDRVSGAVVYNQPAGHLEPGESLTEAARREVLEETTWCVDLIGYLGVARLVGADGITYLRHSFLAIPSYEVSNQTLDDGIIAAHWLTRDEIIALSSQLRSSLVMSVIELHRQGNVAPLSLVLDS